MRPRFPTAVTTVAALAALAAFGTGALNACRGSAPRGDSATGGARRGGNVITAEEIASIPEARDAYQIVERLRPQFLRARGQTSTRRGGAGTYASVYLGDQRLGGLATLRDILASGVREIRYLSASDAATRWGTGTVGGVIQVTERPR